jgi:adiponectin receptor
MPSLSRKRKQGEAQTNGPIPLLSMDAKPSAQPRQPVLSSFQDLPTWYQDNPFILRGYRPVSDSVRLCWESWFYLHNETVNIFSHLVPAIYFLAAQWLLHRYLSVHYPDSSYEDRMAFAIFLLTVTICFGLSSAYHTLMNHSFFVSHLFLSLDLVGIVIHILGNFVSGIYVVFYCEPTLQRVYWTMVCSFFFTM